MQKSIFSFIIWYLLSFCLLGKVLECELNEFLFSSTCYERCPFGYFSNYQEMTCESCDNSCLSCIGKRENDCTSCPEHKFLLPTKGICVSHCENELNITIEMTEHLCERNCPKPEYYLDSSITKSCFSFCGANSIINELNSCLNCDESCASCLKEFNAKSCLTCLHGSFLLPMGKNSHGLIVGNCVNKIPDGWWNKNGILQKCHFSCKSCISDGNSMVCNICNKSFFLFQNLTCVANCGPKFYPIRGKTLIISSKP